MNHRQPPRRYRFLGATIAAVGSYKLEPFAIYWAVWILMFLVPELTALAVKPGDSLSDNWWAIEKLSISHPLANWTWQHWLMAAIVWGLFAWLSVHLPFGWLR